MVNLTKKVYGTKKTQNLILHQSCSIKFSVSSIICFLFSEAIFQKSNFEPLLCMFLHLAEIGKKFWCIWGPIGAQCNWKTFVNAQFTNRPIYDQNLLAQSHQGGNFFLEKVSLLFCVLKDLYKQDQVYVFATFMQIGQNPRWRIPCQSVG